MWTGLTSLLSRVVGDVAGTVAADWPYLLASIVAAAALTAYVGRDGLAGWLRRRRWSAVTGAVRLGPAMAFLVTGAGTSVGAITGALLIARRVVGPVIALLLAGATVIGWTATITLR